MENENSAPQNTKGDKEKLLLTIEGKQYEWNSQYITGSQIKQLAGIPLEVDVFLSIKEPWEDELIPNDEKVNLARRMDKA
jgi:Multiubiquitin